MERLNRFKGENPKIYVGVLVIIIIFGIIMSALPIAMIIIGIHLSHIFPLLINNTYIHAYLFIYRCQQFESVHNTALHTNMAGR